MTKTKLPRNDGAVATIHLDGIRSAAREVRTLFPETGRPAINTLMNTITRELGLGPSYGAALDAARRTPAPAALPADHRIAIRAKMTCPEWVRVMMGVFGVVHTTQETFRGKPVYDLRFNDVPMTGSPEDAGRAALDFIAKHPLLARDDVKIRKVEAKIIQPFKRPGHIPASDRPVPQSYDPCFAQDLPAGFWMIESTLLFELDRTDPLEALLRRVAKASLYDGANKIYRPTTTLALRNEPGQKPLLALHVKRKLITADPRTSLVSLEDMTKIIQMNLGVKINAKEMEAFRKANLVGEAIASMAHTPLAFRLDPICEMNGRTVTDQRRPALLVDAGAALLDVSPSALGDGKRDVATDAKILAAANIEVGSTEGYRISLLRPMKPQSCGGPGYSR